MFLDVLPSSWRRKPAIARYALAILVTAVVVAVRGSLDPVLRDYVPYLSVVPAIVFASWYCGLGPSILATILAFVAEHYYFVVPRHSFTLHGPTQLAGLLTYIFVAGVLLASAELSHRDREKLRQSRDRLEERVAERTRELQNKNEQLIHQAEVVRELSGRLLQMQDDERRRIARELHDSVGQLLVAVDLNTNRILATPQRLNPELAAAAEENVRLVAEIHREVRTISYLLHPPLIDEAGLCSALRWYVEGFAQRSRIHVDLDLPPDLGRLPRDLELCLFRVVQESLTNIHRHSGSQSALVRIRRENGSLHLEVQDSGKGIAWEKQLELNSDGKTGVGIRGMRERLRQFSGTLEVSSSPGGTAVIAQLPFVGQAAAAANDRVA